MIKTFYKTAPVKKIFFSPGQKVKSYAYGDEVHLDFLNWRRRYLESWNSPKENFWLLENGSIDGNAAKIDKVGDFSVATISEKRKSILKSETDFSPLWFEGRELTVTFNGELSLNGQKTGISLGRDLKAWGASILWKKGQTERLLFVYGKNELLESELRVYRIDLRDGLALQLLAAIPKKATLMPKARLYCFSSHIFLISDGHLDYYYYNDRFERLEEVAIGDNDTPNSEKDFCAEIKGDVVCDGDGYIYYCAGNRVCYFSIGYPSRLGYIDIGESNEIVRIQTFRETLFVYYRSRITEAYTTMAYVIKETETTAKLFNTDSQYNLFYAEKNGLLYYIKIPPTGQDAFIIRKKESEETKIAQVTLYGAKHLFCVNGTLYLNSSYVSAT